MTMTIKTADWLIKFFEDGWTYGDIAVEYEPLLFHADYEIREEIGELLVERARTIVPFPGMTNE